MNIITFEELQTNIRELFQQGAFETALELANQEGDRFPEYAHLLYFWRIVLSARAGDTVKALGLLREVLETGFWYGEPLLLNSASFEPLRAQPEFNELVELNRQMRAQDPRERLPILTLRPEGRCQEEGHACPLLIALHENGETAQDAIEFWQPAASEGWLVGAVQSTQGLWRGSYVWDDHDLAAQDVSKHFALLRQQYRIDEERIVVAGYGTGGGTALWLALSQTVPAAGFISVGLNRLPMQAPQDLPGLEPGENSQGLRGYLIYGEEENDPVDEGIEALADVLNRAGIPTDVEAVPLAALEIPSLYESSILRALEFIGR